MIPKNILVLFGGISPEHEVSVNSAANVIGVIHGLGHYVIPVYITRGGKWLMYDGKPDNIKGIDWDKFGTPAALSPCRVNGGLMRVVVDKVKVIPVDVVFPVLHGECGEDGTVQGLCELAGIPYVGCGVLASAVCMDKAMTNMVAKHLRIPQAEYVVIHKEEMADSVPVFKRIRYKVGYPCFVKPATGGSSIGVSKAANKKELETALAAAFKLGSKVVVEKAVTGREIEVGVLGTGTNARASVPGEIVPDGDFYDYEAKYEKADSKTLVPADLSAETVEIIQQHALALYREIGGRGMARVDFFIDEKGGVFFNEINTVPGFTAISMYAMMWKASGVDLGALLAQLIDSAAVGA